MTLAVGLLWISLGLGFPQAYFALVRDPDAGFNPLILGFTLAALAFSAVLNVLVYRRRNWARIVVLLLVLVGVGFLLLSPEDPLPSTLLEDALTILSTGLDLFALYLLFTPPGAAWFRRSP